ncbi:hypothetical protein KIPB_010568 [Kipferlia bialata]|uniref:Uncharacterized protein n=1 Tax=Kipferlia bialata TaxID=797122 RepID=A0A9K3D5C5_9EUKA|nr:hypothetical protein KIPB_010568 [Kipferlia bialata]|eukprot:g10568.t1
MFSNIFGVLNTTPLSVDDTGCDKGVLPIASRDDIVSAYDSGDGQTLQASAQMHGITAPVAYHGGIQASLSDIVNTEDGAHLVTELVVTLVQTGQHVFDA